jgi:hypothetical protein
VRSGSIVRLRCSFGPTLRPSPLCGVLRSDSVRPSPLCTAINHLLPASPAFFDPNLPQANTELSAANPDSGSLPGTNAGTALRLRLRRAVFFCGKEFSPRIPDLNLHDDVARMTETQEVVETLPVQQGFARVRCPECAGFLQNRGQPASFFLLPIHGQNRRCCRRAGGRALAPGGFIQLQSRSTRMSRRLSLVNC